MDRTVYKTAFLFQVLLFLMIGTQMLRFWFDPFAWDWPSIMHPRVFHVLLLELVAIPLFILILTVRSLKNELLVKTIALFALFVINFGLSQFLSLVDPFLIYSEPLALQQGLNAAQFDALESCERVAMFAEVASNELNVANNNTEEPFWMHEGLKKIPKETIAICLANEIEKNVFVIASTDDFNEAAVKKNYALTIEADRLQVLDRPVVLNALKIAVCTSNADPFGNLTKQYYFAVNEYVPGHYYYSRNNIERMRKEICKK